MEEEDDRKPAAVDSHDDSDSCPDSKHEKRPKRAKPALKKAQKREKEKKHLKWDEEVIEEHDQLRGTRMKIEEPNTPYTHYDSGAESDDSRRPKSPANQKPTLQWDVLQNKLDSVAAVRDAYPSSPSDHGKDTETDQSDVEEERKKEMRKLEFKEHRKRHYNEMELVRKFRKEHPDLLAPDAEANDGDDENED